MFMTFKKFERGVYMYVLCSPKAARTYTCLSWKKSCFITVQFSSSDKQKWEISHNSRQLKLERVFLRNYTYMYMY